MYDTFVEDELSRVKSFINFDNKIIELDKILSNTDIDEIYKTYFSSEVIWWIYQENLRRSSLSNFNLDKKDYKKINQELNIYYYYSSIFSESDFEIILKNALNLIINFTVRPFHTLKWFIFRTELQKPLSEIFLKLNYFSIESLITRFIKNSLLKLISNGHNESIKLENHYDFDFYPDKNISKYEFENIIIKFKESFLQDLTPEKIIHPFQILAGILDKNHSPGYFQIPIQAVIIYLNDYGFKNIREYFENLCIMQNLTSLSFDELKIYLVNFIKNIDFTTQSDNEMNFSEGQLLSSENDSIINKNIKTEYVSKDSEGNEETETYELLIQPDRAELIRIAKQLKNEVRSIDLTSSPEEYSEINQAASEISKYLSYESFKSEKDNYLIKPIHLRSCKIDEIIIFADELNESTLEFEFNSTLN